MLLLICIKNSPWFVAVWISSPIKDWNLKKQKIMAYFKVTIQLLFEMLSLFKTT